MFCGDTNFLSEEKNPVLSDRTAGLRWWLGAGTNGDNCLLNSRRGKISVAMKGGAMLGMYKNVEVNRQEFEAACGGMQGRISDEACQAELQCKELREQLGLWGGLTFNFEQCEYVKWALQEPAGSGILTLAASWRKSQPNENPKKRLLN